MVGASVRGQAGGVNPPSRAVRPAWAVSAVGTASVGAKFRLVEAKESCESMSQKHLREKAADVS